MPRLLNLTRATAHTRIAAQPASHRWPSLASAGPSSSDTTSHKARSSPIPPQPTRSQRTRSIVTLLLPSRKMTKTWHDAISSSASSSRSETSYRSGSSSPSAPHVASSTSSFSLLPSSSQHPCSSSVLGARKGACAAERCARTRTAIVGAPSGGTRSWSNRWSAQGPPLSSSHSGPAVVKISSLRSCASVLDACTPTASRTHSVTPSASSSASSRCPLTRSLKSLATSPWASAL